MSDDTEGTTRPEEDHEVQQTPRSPAEEARDLGASAKRTFGSVYRYIFDRPPAQNLLLSVVTTVLVILVDSWVERQIDTVVASVADIVPLGELFTPDGVTLAGLLVTLLYTVYKRNRIENRVSDMNSVRTDGGTAPPEAPPRGPGDSDESESDGTGEGALVGLIGGAIAGSPGGPAGAVVGAVAGAVLGDALEKQGRRDGSVEDDHESGVGVDDRRSSGRRRRDERR